MVPRSVVMGLDKTERVVSLVAGAIAIILAGIISPHLLRDTWVTDTAKPNGAGACAAPFHLVNKVCEHRFLTHPSYWLPQFLMILIIALLIIAFAQMRKRVGVAFSALLLGLAIGATGAPFLLLGGWLVIRALRLQKYGDATFSGSSRLARERAKAKREGRDAAPATASKSARGSKAQSAPRTASAPVASKRYTPKNRPRKR
jgi:hypothetical protein